MLTVPITASTIVTKIRNFFCSVSIGFFMALMVLFPLLLSAQVRFDVAGDLKIRGKIDVSASQTNTSSLFIGKEAGLNNSTGSANTFLGVLTGRSNTDGGSNTASGYAALYANTTGDYNTAIGRDVLFSNTTGNYNTAIGYAALGANTTGLYNTASGASALISNKAGSSNTATGYVAPFSNTNGSSNTATGYAALYYNTTGANNTAIGRNAIYFNTTGNHNTAIGSEVLFDNTTGFSNTAIGYAALSTNTTGMRNTASGYHTLISNTFGANNMAAGYTALFSNTIGNHNTANGSGALYSNTTGNFNVASGVNALFSNTTGSLNTASGAAANTSVNNLEYATAIGAEALTNANDKTVIGRNVAGTVIGGYANWSNLSDGRFKENVRNNVPGLIFIRQLRPVTYTINIDRLQRHITAQMPDSLAARFRPTREEQAAAEQEIRTGFIAQEVETVVNKIGYSFDGVNAPKNNTDNYSIAYAQFVPSLVKGMQEQQEQIEEERLANAAQAREIVILQRENEALTARLAKLEALLQKATTRKELPAEVVDPGGAKLEQNHPNPFQQATIVGYSIPASVKKAVLRVVDIQGKTLKSIPIQGRGAGQIRLEAHSLAPGSYQYSLFLDGRLLKTKRMIIAASK